MTFDCWFNLVGIWVFGHNPDERIPEMTAALEKIGREFKWVYVDIETGTRFPSTPVETPKNLEAEFHKQLKHIGGLSGGWRRREGRTMEAFRTACEICGLEPTGEKKK